MFYLHKNRGEQYTFLTYVFYLKEVIEQIYLGSIIEKYDFFLNFPFFFTCKSVKTLNPEPPKPPNRSTSVI